MKSWLVNRDPYIGLLSGQITSIIPKPECFGDFGGDSLTKPPPFGVTSAGWSL